MNRSLSRLAQSGVLLRRLGTRSLFRKANWLLGTCIFICAFVAASLSFFALSVQTALDRDIANYLGAPLVIRANQTIDPEPFIANGVDQLVTTSSFTTGAVSTSEYQSVSIKGVSENYPLQGELIIDDGNGVRARKAIELADGSAWVGRRVMDELNISIGDSVQIGRARLTILGKVVHEPDRLTQLQHALPRVIVNQSTLKQTQVSENNDRGEHRLLIGGEASELQHIEQQLTRWIPFAVDTLKPDKGRHPFSRISQRAERLLNLVLVLILLMCGGAAAALADHTVNHYRSTAAVLRCMGVKRRSVAWALCAQLSILALLMSALGCLVAWLLQPVFHNLMQPHISLESAQPLWGDLIAPMAIGVLTMLTFVVPKLQQLGSLSVNAILRGESKSTRTTILTAIPVTSLTVGILWVSSDNTQLTLLLLGAIGSLIVLSFLVGWGLSKTTAQLHRFFSGPVRIAVRTIGRSPKRHIIPLVSVSLAMMALLMTITLRGSFLDVLQIQSLETDGNLIFTGLPAEQRNTFEQTVSQQGAMIKTMHPVVSAKLVSVNGVDLDNALTKESDTREETRSTVRLSWADVAPSNNRMLQGTWPVPGSNEVSVEAEVMSDLGLNLGDELGFQIGDQVLYSRISSQREYRGGGSRMMFWFMFAPDALAPFAQHAMGGLQANKSSTQLVSALTEAFPQLRITNLERQIAGIRDIMIVLTRLMNTILGLLLLGALMIILATSFVSADRRELHSQVYRALGLKRYQCYLMAMSEQLLIGVVACCVGVLGVQLIAGLLFENLFSLSYRLDWGYALSTALIVVCGFVTLGALFAYQQTRKPLTLN